MKNFLQIKRWKILSILFIFLLRFLIIFSIVFVFLDTPISYFVNILNLNTYTYWILLLIYYYLLLSTIGYIFNKIKYKESYVSPDNPNQIVEDKKYSKMLVIFLTLVHASVIFYISAAAKHGLYYGDENITLGLFAMTYYPLSLIIQGIVIYKLKPFKYNLLYFLVVVFILINFGIPYLMTKI